MRRAAILSALVGLVLVTVAPAALAHETHPSVEQLENAGWGGSPEGCFDPDGPAPELGLHCFNPGDGPTANVIYYEPGTDHFAGTEIIRFTGDYEGIPCPGSHTGEWEYIVTPGGAFWACHHPKGGPNAH